MREKRMDSKFHKRMKRRLYYGEMSDLSKPSLPLTELAVGYFHDSASQKLGHIDIDTASNVIKSNRVSPCSVVLSMLYAKRLRQRNKEYLSTVSSSDIFFISMMMASKYLYDEGVDEEVFNDEWADNTDQDVDDVNKMEVDFLQAMDWKLFVRPDEFEDTLVSIERRLALQEGLKRNWFTYAELDVLLNSDFLGTMWMQVGVECTKLMSAISAVYLTSILSMLGSTALAVQVSAPLSSAAVAFFTLQTAPQTAIFSHGLSPLGLAPSPPPYDFTSSNMALHPNESGFENFDSKEEKNSTQDFGGGDTIPIESLMSEISRNEDCETQQVNYSLNAEDPENRPASASLWSILFLDSLLSQLWAVASLKPKLMSMLGVSFSHKPEQAVSTIGSRGCRGHGSSNPRKRARRNPGICDPLGGSHHSTQSQSSVLPCAPDGSQSSTQDDSTDFCTCMCFTSDANPSLSHLEKLILEKFNHRQCRNSPPTTYGPGNPLLKTGPNSFCGVSTCRNKRTMNPEAQHQDSSQPTPVLVTSHHASRYSKMLPEVRKEQLKVPVGFYTGIFQAVQVT
ncbi:uncharacterized protein LOC131938328 [Physella acuta]|uniref:uncharacterized protein LOC131938328 n=1 Tax=Physella acuta TaxID=109671 RepID=UPI0027DB17A2|nr:uncharacterized protein LOC131938328 [Physella acuta]